MKTESTIPKLIGMIVLNDDASSAIRLALGAFLFVALFVSASEAQQRTFVSGLGNDSNQCSRIAPCRTFTQAISVTNAGGEVVVLDSAGYGAFAITKAVTVQAPPGVYAGISVFSGDGISINGGGTDSVFLRGLTVNDQGSSGNGISFNTGGTLHVESCVLNGFASGRGLSINGVGTLELKDSIARGNGIGVVLVGSSTAAIDNVRLEGNLLGLQAEDGSKVTVSNSLASNNDSGFQALSHGSDVQLNIEGCIVSNNASDGIVAESMHITGVATVRVSNSTVTDNGVGFDNHSSILLSRGNNTLEGNSTATNGTIGSYTAK